ncbi:MAG: L,D-transpeptidase family protein [Brachymonas sp.]|nr:L,D-transpeptidase family protein [Brachymonas sp.]
MPNLHTPSPAFSQALLRPAWVAALAAAIGLAPLAACAQKADDLAAQALGRPAMTASAAASAETAAAESTVVPRRWLDARSQKPLAVAQQALERLAAAETEGLLPQDYDVAELQAALAAAASQRLSAEEGEQLEQRINQAVLRYLNDLHHGRINPKTIGENYSEDARPPFDAEALLAQYAPAGDLAPVWQAATPQVPMYAGLRAELQRYLQLRDDPAWAEPLPLPPKGKSAALNPDYQDWPGLQTLAQRLVQLGDLPPEAVADAAALEASLPIGLQTFQRRHGLKATGRIDRATVAQLNVPPAQRAGQIAQTMERLRWAPLHQAGRMLVVNVPEYRLRAYTLGENAQVLHVLAMDVIVGKANHQRTPLFNKDMERVEFSPYWNVPHSITSKEMVPRLHRDPDYVRRNGYEIIGPGGARTDVNEETLAALASGRMRLRQRPGRGNALGDVKFIFPNKDNIYLHHTSAPGLFKRDYRALSHGCVRVEDPVALAQFVLQGDPAWPEQRIRHVMDKRISHNVAVPEPLPVILTYLTTVMDEDGRLKFVPDVYGQDKRLKNALAKRHAVRQ